MAYKYDDSQSELIQRKEFYWIKQWPKQDNIYHGMHPRFSIEHFIQKSSHLRLLGHQQFVRNFMNPNTKNKRLHLEWSTGSGKTLATIAIAMTFIESFRIEKDLGHQEIGSIFIIGFSERQFKAELLRYPEFGFITKEEQIRMDKLRRIAAKGNMQDLNVYTEFVSRIKSRLTNRKGNGYFRFYGYKAFVNRILISNEEFNINTMSEEEIRKALAAGKITYNEDLLKEFKNSLIISDEIHNVYNSLEKNNWGIAIQAVLDREPSVRILTLSATPFNNSPTEVVDLLNLLLPKEERVSKSTLFHPNGKLKNGSLEKIGELSKGKFSFLIDTNPKNYPTMILEGDQIPGVPYLKFVRCPMSPFHYETFKNAKESEESMMHDNQYLIDFALPNPGSTKTGIYRAINIKQDIPAASQSWKDKNGIDYQKNRIVGNIFEAKRIGQFSTKYETLLQHVLYAIQHQQGKIFIYHNVVHMSGVLFIEQLLLRNGILDEYSGSSDNTLCSICGRTKREHKKTGGSEGPEGPSPGGPDSDPASSGSLADNESDSDNSVDTLDGESMKVNPPSMAGINDSTTDNMTINNLATNESYDMPCNKKTRDPFDLSSRLVVERSRTSMIFGEKSVGSLASMELGEEKFYYIDYLDIEPETPEGRKLLADWLEKMAAISAPLYIRVHNETQGTLAKILLSDHGFSYHTCTQEYSYILRQPSGKSKAEANSKTKLGGNPFAKKRKAAGPTTKIANRYGSQHDFIPVRFVMAHSEVEKKKLDQSLEKYNSVDNIEGQNFMILVGSKIIKESYDLKAIQNVFIVGRPDNISTFIQIRGRAIRKNSHKGLPPEQQIVRIKIFVTSMPDKKTLSYEEQKYKEKLLTYQEIQQISKYIHENAIDAAINTDKSIQNSAGDPLGILPFNPQTIIRKPISLAQLSKNTFSIYYAKQEINTIKVIIKRLFIELSSIWTYDELFEAVRNPPEGYEHEINTELFTKANFNIALSQLVWRRQKNYVEPIITKTEAIKKGGANGAQATSENESDLFIEGIEGKNFLPEVTGGSIATTPEDLEFFDDSDGPKSGGAENNKTEIPTETINKMIDSLFNPYDKMIYLQNGYPYVIVPIVDGKTQLYCLFQYDEKKAQPNIDFEMLYRLNRDDYMSSINMNSFVQTKRIDFDYVEKKKIFIRKHRDTLIENMENIVCEYGSMFHIKFLEECIEYVFNVWTNPNVEKSPDHDFYFKMLYYYDLLSLVMWAYTCKPKIFQNYTRYAIPVKAKDIKLKTLQKYENREEELEDVSPPDDSDLASSGVINLLKATYNKTSNYWIPKEFRTEYNKILNKTSDLFAGRKKKSKTFVKVNADLLPIGHYISEFPRIYHPEKGWDENPIYLQNEEDYRENNFIVGFDERSATGVHIRFKIRNPIHNIKKHKDSRETEKGTVCKSKSKEYLIGVAKKLDVLVPDKVNVEELCVLIRSKLIRLELKERIKKSKIKYFYFHYEKRPETR